MIIGGGPAGLTAAIYCARANLHPIVACGGVKGSLVPGGQLMLTSEVENFPGFKSIEGPQLMSQMRDQAIRCGARLIDSWAHSIVFARDENHQIAIGDDTLETRSVVLAMGASARWLNLEGEQKYMNNGVSACATCDGPLPMFRGKTVAVVGGGDSACEEALFLSKFAKNIVLIHRKGSLRASKVMADRVLAHPSIDILWNKEVVQYFGDSRLEGVVLKDCLDGSEVSLECKGLFMAIGHDPNTAFLKETGIDLDSQGYLKVTENVFTNIKGVFAAGDCHDKTYRQAVSAAGFGCQAAMACERYLQ